MEREDAPTCSRNAGNLSHRSLWRRRHAPQRFTATARALPFADWRHRFRTMVIAPTRKSRPPASARRPAGGSKLPVRLVRRTFDILGLLGSDRGGARVSELARERDFMAAAAPVYGLDGAIVAALSMTGPSCWIAEVDLERLGEFRGRASAQRLRRTRRGRRARATAGFTGQEAMSYRHPHPIRAPRGNALSCASWLTEAPLRMLMNNLDPEVAERPEELVVYGGIGKAARNWACYERIVAVLKRLRDDETLLIQSGKPVGVFGTHADAPRVLIANSNLVPRWASWEQFNDLDRKGLMMYGQMTAGSWIYIGSQGIVQGTYETFAEAGRRH